jgi:hypothetical protein
MVMPPLDSENIDPAMKAQSKSPLSKGLGLSEAKGGFIKKSGKGMKKASREKGAFGRLLADVTNEQSKEAEYNDVKVAVETQCEDALEMANGWIREEADAKYAEDLHEELVKEEKQCKEQALKQGESEALKVAIEERRRVQADAAARREMESKDSDFAKQVVIGDAEEEHEFKQLLSKDDEAAAKLHAELQDELLAEELMKKEEAEFLAMQKKKQELIDKDSKLAEQEMAREEERIRSEEEQRQKKVLEQAMKDFELARKTQIELDVEANKNKSSQEKEDANYALKMSIMHAREAHRRAKRLEVIHSSKVFNSIKKVAQQWLDADAEVEDVAGGLCLTLLLPYLRDIKVSALDKKRVDLEAYRIVGSEEQKAGLATVDNSQYSAEFVIDGRNVSISDKDVSFEYSSESGLLFVYVENVHLDAEDGMTGSDPSSAGSGSGSGPSGSSWTSSLKNGFKRMFGSKE